MNNRKTMLAGAASSLVLLTAVGAVQPVFAQSAPASGEPKEVEALVVTGFRSSHEKALDLKKAETAAVDTTLAEDIAEYNKFNVGMPLNKRPDGAYTQW